MGHLYHGYVKIEIEPPNSSYSKGGSQPMSLVLGYVAYNCHGYGSFDGFLPATLGANLMGYNDLYFKACCHCKVKMGFPNHWPKSISNLLCQFEVQLGSISALNHIKPLFLLVTPPQTDGKLQNNMACIYGHIYILYIHIVYIYIHIYILCMYVSLVRFHYNISGCCQNHRNFPDSWDPPIFYGSPSNFLGQTLQTSLNHLES